MTSTLLGAAAVAENPRYWIGAQVYTTTFGGDVGSYPAGHFYLNQAKELWTYSPSIPSSTGEYDVLEIHSTGPDGPLVWWGVVAAQTNVSFGPLTAEQQSELDSGSWYARWQHEHFVASIDLDDAPRHLNVDGDFRVLGNLDFVVKVSYTADESFVETAPAEIVDQGGSVLFTLPAGNPTNATFPITVEQEQELNAEAWSLRVHGNWSGTVSAPIVAHYGAVTPVASQIVPTSTARCADVDPARCSVSVVGTGTMVINRGGAAASATALPLVAVLFRSS